MVSFFNDFVYAVAAFIFQEFVLKCCHGREFIPFDGNMVLSVCVISALEDD